MAMLRSIKFIEKIAFYSRATAVNAAYQRQFGEILKCTYTTRVNEQTLNQLRWVKTRPLVREVNLKDILIRIREQEISSLDATNILKSCGREGTLHAELVDEIWAVLKNKVSLDITHFNALLKVHIDKEKNFEPVKLLEEMLNAGIEPNRATFNYFIRAFALQGNVDGVINILEEMKSKGIPASDFTYNNLILAFANDGNLEKMQEIENVMKRMGFAVQADTLNALLKGYAKCGKIEDINLTFDRFKEMNIVLLNRDVLDVIFELIANGHHEVVDEVARRLYKSIELPTSLKSIVEKAMHRKLDAVVFKLLTFVDENDKITLAKLYLEALTQAPAEQIDEAVKVLETHGITLQTHATVLEVGLNSNSAPLIRTILYDMRAKTKPIEMKHFLKLIQLESVNGTNAVLNVVHSMKKDFNVDPDVYTIRDVILPCMNAVADPHLAFARLRTVESNTFRIARSMFERCLLDNKMQAAYEIANDYKTYSFNLENIRKSLIDAFVATNDVQHFAKIVNILQFSMDNYKNSPRIVHESVRDETSSESESSDEEPNNAAARTSSARQVVAVGDVLRDTIKRIIASPQQIEALLRALVDEGLTIPAECALHIKRYSANALTASSIELLNALSSGELNPTSLNVEERRRRTLDLLSSDELQKMIEIEEEKGRDTVRLKKILFNSYIREKNAAKVEELATHCVVGINDHRNVINMYITLGDTEKALNYFNEIRKTIPTFRLLRYQATRLAHALFNEQREWNAILRIFTDNKADQPPEGSTLVDIHALLRSVTKTGNVAQLDELCKILIENNFMLEDARMGGSLVRVHLKNNDLPEAVRTFERQWKEKRITSAKLPLMKALIQANDMDNLQNVFDIVLSKYSEANAVLTLAQSFIEIGNIRQANVVMKNNLLRNSNDSFRKHCGYCNTNGDYKVLEGFLAATDGLEYDREDIYYYLLLHYSRTDRTQEALELWHKQLDGDEKPSVKFLQKLASHLNEKGVDVPFRVPLTRAEPEPIRRAFMQKTPTGAVEKETPRKFSTRTTPPSKQSPDEIGFRDALQNRDVDAALNLWQKINANEVQYAVWTSGLVKLLCQCQRNAEAVEIAMQSIAAGRNLHQQVLLTLIQQIASEGDWNLIERIGDSLPRSVMRSIRFGTRRLKAYEAHGQLSEFFSKILEKLESASDNIKNIDDQIPLDGLLQLLEKQSISLNEFEEFAMKAAEKGSCRPLNILWAHYFLVDSPESSQLYDRIELGFPTQFRAEFLARYLTRTKNVEKLNELSEFAKDKNIASTVMYMQNATFDFYLQENRTKDALAMIENGSITVQNLPKSVLNKLKRRIEANGDQIPSSLLHSTDKDH